MEIKEIISAACCGRFNVNIEINKPLSKAHLQVFLDKGFIETKKFTEAGIFYVENLGIIASCIYGSNKIQLKTKDKDKWQESYNKFKEILLAIE